MRSLLSRLNVRSGKTFRLFVHFMHCMNGRQLFNISGSVPALQDLPADNLTGLKTQRVGTENKTNEQNSSMVCSFASTAVKTKLTTYSSTCQKMPRRESLWKTMNIQQEIFLDPNE
jgi:hypothetical protein